MNWRQVSIAPFLFLIKLYRLVFSPFVGYHCRHQPTCSVYAAQALKKHGVIKGCLLAGWRVLRCGPGGTSGVDPVPEIFSLNLKHDKKEKTCNH